MFVHFRPGNPIVSVIFLQSKRCYIYSIVSPNLLWHFSLLLTTVKESEGLPDCKSGSLTQAEMVDYYCFLHVAGRGWTADHVCCGQCVRLRNGSVLELACLRRLSAYSSSRFIQQTLFLHPWLSVLRHSSRFERSRVLFSGTGKVTEYQNYPNVQ